MKKNYELFSTGPALKLMPKEVLQAKGILYLKEIRLQEGMDSSNGKHISIC